MLFDIIYDHKPRNTEDCLILLINWDCGFEINWALRSKHATTPI